MLFIFELETAVNAFLPESQILRTCIVFPEHTYGVETVFLHQGKPVHCFRIAYIIPRKHDTAHFKERGIITGTPARPA